MERIPSKFRFLIRYRPEKQNVTADTLSRLDRESIDPLHLRTQRLLGSDCLDEKIQTQSADLAPVEELEEVQDIDRVKDANRNAEAKEYRDKLRGENSD